MQRGCAPGRGAISGAAPIFDIGRNPDLGGPSVQARPTGTRRAPPRITRCGVVPPRPQPDPLRVGALSSRQAPAPVEVLYRRYRRDVLAVAYTNIGNRADAEDVAQTTFLNAHRAIVGGARPTNERAWLLAIARNLCHKRFRGLAQRPREEPFDESHHPTGPEDGERTRRRSCSQRAPSEAARGARAAGCARLHDRGDR